MKERDRNIAVGLTTLIGVVGLLAMLLLFGYVPEWLAPGYHIKIDLPYAAGLHEGSRVHLAGVDVGQVDAVDLRPLPQVGVVVTVRIRNSVSIPVKSSVTVTQPLLGSSPSIEFHDYQIHGQITQYLPTDGSAEIPGRVSSLTSGLTSHLKTALAEPLQQFHTAADSFEALSEQWQQVGKKINQQLTPQKLSDVDAGRVTPNLATVIVRVDQSLAEMHKAIDGINRYVQDDQLRQNVETNAANARKLTDKLNGGIDKIQKTVTTSVEQVQKRYVALADDLSKVVDSLQGVLGQVRQGHGTVGKLIHSDQLYKNLNDTVSQMQAAIKQMQLLVEKWKAEGVPVHF